MLMKCCIEVIFLMLTTDYISKITPFDEIVCKILLKVDFFMIFQQPVAFPLRTQESTVKIYELVKDYSCIRYSKFESEMQTNDYREVCLLN